MYSSIVSLRRNYLPRKQHLKLLGTFWSSRWLKTEGDSSKPAAGVDHNDRDVRPFDEIPTPKFKMNLKGIFDVYNAYKFTEGFTKLYGMTTMMFAMLGPIYKDAHLPGNLYSGIVHVMDPDDFEKVFRAEGKYPRRPLVDIWVEHRKRRNYFPGIVNSDGEEWHRIRQTIAPKIMRPKIVEENIDNFNAVTKDAIARFVKLKEACGPNDHIPDLEAEISKWSTESIGTVGFDTRLGLYEDPPKQEALDFIKEVQNIFTLTHKLTFSLSSKIILKYMDTPTFKKFLKSADTILDMGQGFVAKKMRELKDMAEKGIDPSGSTQVVPLLTYLLTKKGLTPEEVNAHAIDVVAAGVHTTANSVVWWLYNLARFPRVQEKLYQEIESVVRKDEDVTTQHLAKLPYLKACLKESMRLTPTTAVTARILEQDVVLSGYIVPAESMVIMETHCTALSEKYFKDPQKFKPERWLRENKVKNHAFASTPFGFGTRMCVGRRIAELEMHVFICKLLQRFRLEYHHEPLESYQNLLLVPDKPVQIKFVNRL